MKIFVTGGAGFIGRHLVECLLNSDYSVTIYDNFNNIAQTSISHLIKNGASIVKGDITDYKLLSKSLPDFDSVIHLAAQIDVQQSIKFPENTNEVNVTGSINLLRACVANKVKNIVNASSAAVYGKTKDLPVNEKSQTVPISPYGASKLAVEHYIQAFSHSFELNCISLRIFNVYGRGQSDSYAGVITKFKEKIKKNKPLVIFGDGSNTRDFVLVDDVVQSIQKAIAKIDGKKGDYYNIASGNYITINDLANLMITISGKTLPIEHTKPRQGDIHHSQTSIQLATKELGYSPNVQLKNGLEMLLKS